jgi:hypothetical protein
MICNHNFALVTLALGACVATSQAQTLLYSTPFTNTAGWVQSGSMIFSRSNDQFLATGTYTTYLHTNDPWATYGDAYHPIPTSGPLADNQTLEARVDLVGVNQNDVWADLHVWGEPQAATYGFFKGPDALGLLKGWNWMNSMAWFFCEDLVLKNQNVTLVLALTRRGSNLEINARVLDKDNNNQVLFSRTVIDTPQADPVLANRAVRGMLSMSDLAGVPPPITSAPGNVCLGLGWVNPTHGPVPAAQAVFDNVEVWQHKSSRPNVVAWGWNTYGETNVPGYLTNAVAVAAGSDHSLALRGDGTVIGWGRNNGGATDIPAGLTNVVAIAAGGCFWTPSAQSLALKADGTVVAWGTDGYNPLSTPAGLTNMVAVAADGHHCLALRADGTVVAWGENYCGQTDVPADLNQVVAITAGEENSLALRADGTVVAWGGGNSVGQNDIPAGLTNAIAVAAGWGRSLALRADGTVVVWGENSGSTTSVPAGLTDIVAVAAGNGSSGALRADGTVVMWGTSEVATNAPPGLSNVVALASCCGNSLALIGDGPPVVQASLSHPTMTAEGFAVSVPTQSGRVYRLEYKNSLANGNWTALPLVAGTGHERTLTDPSASGSSQRFYRVRRW